MKIRLTVPFFSQRENNVIWADNYDQQVNGFSLGAIQYRSCNITCLTMILHYYSIIDLTPDQLLDRIRDKDDSIHSLEKIVDIIFYAIKKGKIIGTQGRGRPIYECNYNGKIQRIAITVSNNGFIVGANPN